MEVVELIHGQRVADPYRWLEDGASAEVTEWTEAQNRYTEEWLAREPARSAIRARLEALLTIGVLGTPTPAGGRYLYVRRDGAVNQPILYVRDGVDGADRVAVDPNALASDGTVALDWYHVSPDGSRLAYGLSEGGDEQSTLRILDLATGAPLTDAIPRTRACDLAWVPDASGFYYTRYPAPGEVPPGDEVYHRSVYYHRLGADPAADPLVYRPLQKEHWPGVALSDDGRWLIITVARTFDETDLYLQDLQGGGPLVSVAVGLPHLFEAGVVRDVLYVRTNLHGPTFGLYAADPRAPDLASWRTLVAPDPARVLASAGVTAEWLVLDFLERASARLELQRIDGPERRRVDLPTLGGLFGLGYEPGGRELFYGFSSWTVPPSVYRVDLATGEQRLWRRVEADVDPARFDVRQVQYPSRDGTLVTMFVARRRGDSGVAPCFLTGYGGFNIAMTPSFSRSLLLWLEAGGVVAVPNLRGGGEYGEEWHQAGMLGRKQNTFDDFIAAAEWLIAEGITRPELLAVQGGSNGGLLMGAVLTQRPELVRCGGHPGAAARHAALSPLPARAALDTGIRVGR